VPALEDGVQAIEERNARVEADKAWEGSWYRRLLLASAMYATAVLFLWSSNAEAFWFQSLVPAGAYILSTLTLPWLKRRWVGKKGR